jgi:hypothetical protein
MERQGEDRTSAFGEKRDIVLAIQKRPKSRVLLGV